MILNVYKPKDWTSFDVVAKIKGILNSGLNPNVPNKVRRKRKVGHAGTLDPLATGVLVILTDKDTKIQDKIMKSEKEYECEISFGAESPTYDLEGDLTYTKIPKGLDIEIELENHIPKYLGEIEQTVPPFSAVKRDGKKLYIEARKGRLDLETLPKKVVNIYSIEKIEYYIRDNLPTVKLRITCSPGTYIRSLAHDLGKDLGIGAVLVNLIRTRVGNYDIEKSLTLEEIENRLKN